MTKKLWLLIPGILALGVFIYIATTSSDTDFKRFVIDRPYSVEKKILEREKIIHFYMNGSNYFEKNNQTIKGSFLDLQGGKEEIHIKPEKKGLYTFAFQVHVMANNRIALNIRQNRNRLFSRTFHKEKTLHFRKKIDLASGDRLTLILRGHGSVILGNPLLYREKPADKRQYIFLICADTMRADHLPTYGYHRQTAYQITRFARDALVFENAYAQSCWTLPSHMSLFSSLYEFKHGSKRGNIISETVPFLVESLAEKFSTRSFNGGIYVSSRFGFFRGFDYYQSNRTDQLSPLATQEMVKRAIKDIIKNDYPRSLYFLHTYQTHSPYNPLPKYLHLFNKNPKYKMLYSNIHHSGHRTQFEVLKPEVREAFIDLYDAEISAFDEGFGMFIDFLKQKKIYENSMIILFSDHGEEFFDHKGWDHGHSLYNELIRVPLIIKFPGGLFKGQRIQTEVGIIDIMPTILNYYDIDFSNIEVDGLDLIPIIRGKIPERILFSSLTCGRYLPTLPFKISIIKKNRKYIHNLPYTKDTFDFFNPDPPVYNKIELYDLAKDPLENINIHRHYTKYINSFKNIIIHIIKQAKNIQNKQGLKIIMDKKLKEAMKSLGYL